MARVVGWVVGWMVGINGWDGGLLLAGWLEGRTKTLWRGIGEEKEDLTAMQAQHTHHNNHFGNWIRLTRARASIRNLPYQASTTSTLAYPRGAAWVISSCCLSLLLSYPLCPPPLFPPLLSLKQYHHDLPVLKRWMMPVHSSKPACVAWGGGGKLRHWRRDKGPVQEAPAAHIPRGQGCQACQGGACRPCTMYEPSTYLYP